MWIETEEDMRPTRSRRASAEVTDGVMSALRRIIRAIDLHSRALMQRCGLTGPQLLVLSRLADGPPRTVGDLARAIALSQATLTGIVDRLEARGFVTRNRDQADKRRVSLGLTETGRELLGNAPPLLQDSFTTGFEGLADWEQHQILSSLQRIVALMEAREVEAGPILATGPLGGEGDEV